MSLTWSLQALLVRHEAYVAEAEAERKLMREEIDRVTCDRDALQTQNNEVIEENRQLLHQLESANTSVVDSDTHVKSLTATLQSAQDEIHRLNVLARRTQTLEKELERFELEQSRIRTSLSNKTEDERAANLRWQNAERSLAAMQEHVQAIEEEASAERENHLEVVNRLERRRQIEKELGTAEGRLKGAAAARNSQDLGNTAVVSHFVKDILQDNANLQTSVVELRDLLSNANEQVEKLREQLTEHLSPPERKASVAADINLGPTLDQEMAVQDLARNSAQEVHVHHHYHAPTAKADPARRHSQNLRRPRKRRTGIAFSHFNPSSGHHSPSNLSISTSHFPTPSLSSNMSTPADSSPSMGLPSHHRWSMHSTAALSSVPSSPRSSFRSPSLFDRPFSDAGMDSSRPTTPGTDAGDMSYFAALSGQLHGVGIYHSLDEPPRRAASPEGDDDEQDPEHSLVDFSQPVPHVRPIRVRKLRPMSFTDDDLPAAASSNDYSGHGLHRSASHESLLSVSGMDIHTLKSRPSQMLTGQNIRSFSPQPTICVTTAQADRPSLNSKSSQAMLSGVVEDGNDQNAGLGKRVSGWMFGRWGSSPSQPSPLNPARNITVGKPTRSASAQEVRTHMKIRPPGINQPGAILGFLADNTPSRTRPKTRLTSTPTTGLSKEPIMQILNEEELRQSLADC
ncbi:hypothetical protein ANO11243_064450 [Dothideomycetidae sp. 11243]|nr:hypothetical protein ANO11243_064450 [fungal sp. No.11243]